jgi:hypothetical protein
MKLSQIVLIGFALFFSAASAQQGPDARVYENVCLHAESGDLLGERFTILPLGEATYVVYQAADGRVTPASVGQAKLNANSIEFSVNVDGE